MSGAAAKSRISEALRTAVEDRSQRAMGLMLGHAGTTIGRWGADLASWPASALIDLAAKDTEVRAAVVDALTDAPEAASPAIVVRDAGDTLKAMSDTIARLSADLADGRITADEAARELPSIRATLRSLRHLESDLAALVHPSRGRR